MVPDTCFRTLGTEHATRFHREMSPADRLGHGSDGQRKRGPGKPRGEVAGPLIDLGYFSFKYIDRRVCAMPSALRTMRVRAGSRAKTISGLSLRTVRKTGRGRK